MWDSSEDFGAPESVAYFTRSIIIWDDSLKINYGKGNQASANKKGQRTIHGSGSI